MKICEAKLFVWQCALATTYLHEKSVTPYEPFVSCFLQSHMIRVSITVQSNCDCQVYGLGHVSVCSLNSSHKVRDNMTLNIFLSRSEVSQWSTRLSEAWRCPAKSLLQFIFSFFTRSAVCHKRSLVPFFTKPLVLQPVTPNASLCP